MKVWRNEPLAMIQPGTDCEFLLILQFGAPEFDGPIERGRQKQVGKINLGEGRKGEGREGREGGTKVRVDASNDSN